MRLSSALSRRAFLGTLACGLVACSDRGAFAEDLLRTPAQTEGPFYPDHLPLDTDNDLIVVNNQLTSAIGTITHLGGRILSPSGEPVRNAVIEIWQVDGNGAYLHSKSGNAARRDSNFQGFGRFLTGTSGEYYFRTIKPIAYPGRTPHIHVKIRKGDKELLTTQCYVNGDPGNANDGVLRGLTDPAARKAVLVDFTPVPGSRVGELSAHFDIVLGRTPEG